MKEGYSRCSAAKLETWLWKRLGVKVFSQDPYGPWPAQLVCSQRMPCSLEVKMHNLLFLRSGSSEFTLTSDQNIRH